MSSPGIDRRFFDKPPAATTGSPGTAIFSPPSLQSSRPFARSNDPSASTARLVQPPPSAAPTKSDPVPVQWSFESSYNLFGSAPSHGPPHGDPRTPGVLGGTWLGMRKDKNASQPTLHRSKIVGASATRVPCPVPLPNGGSIRVSPPQNLEAYVIPSPAGNARPATHSIHTSLSSSAPHGITHFPDSFSGSQSERIPLHRTVSDSPPDSTRTPLLNIPASTHTPLLTIPASNAPTCASTPTLHSSHPPPSFRHPPSYRPGNFSCVSSTALTGSALMHTHRRLATSSAVPQFRDTALSPGGLDTADASKPSLVPSAALSTIESMSSNTTTETVPEAKTSMTELARRKTEEARKRGFKMKNGKRHHPMSKEEAPYPRDYERKTIDYDNWEHCCAVNLIKRNTFYMFDKPPTKVLDVGCGAGQWIIQCAREWKDTYFVGFDLVPIQPNVTRLGDPRFASRIDWVLGNFLEPFPFEDGEFDFVHVQRVARGVPEDRWDAFFEEVTRVLKVGGAFEMTEEDLFFPGSLDVEDDEDENEDEDVDERESADSESGEAQKENKVTREVREILSPPTLPHSKFPSSVGDAVLHGSLASKSPFGQAHRKGNRTTLPVVQLPTERLAHSSESFLSMQDEDDMSETIDHSAARRSMERSGTMRIEGSHPDASTGADIPWPRSTNPTSEHARTATNSTTPVLGSAAQQSTFERDARSQGYGSQVLTLGGRPNHPQLSLAEDHNLPRVSPNPWYALEHTVADILSHTVGEDNKDYLNVGAGSNLYHANTAPVSNPRDHSLLETAYNELHAARFINLAPLAILNSILVLHFKDVRSHPPTQISLPSMPISTAKPGRKQANIESSKLHRSESYSMPHRPRPPAAPSSRPRDCSSSTSPNPPDSTDGIDDTNATDTDRFAPIVTESAPHITTFRLLGKTAPPEQGDFSESRLSYGNRGMIHAILTARMSEVLACAEEMWEFIEECRESSARWRNPSIAALAEISREEWEDCLSRYTMDMQSRIGMGRVVRERLGWGMREMPRSAERKAFDEAVKKWDKLCRLREEQTPGEKKKRNTRQHPLSRTFKVFVAWK